MQKRVGPPILGIVAVLLLVSAVSAAEVKYDLAKTLSLQRAFATPEKWQAFAYEPERWNGEKGPPSRLCFNAGPGFKSGFCFDAKTRSGNIVEYYGHVEELSLVPLFSNKEPGYGVLFVARGGGNYRRFASLWTYRREEDRFIEIAPPVALGSMGQLALLSTIRPDLEGLLATADRPDAGDPGGETFGLRPYACKIRIFRYSDKSRSFEPAGGYLTKTKYEGDMTPLIIQREMKNIEKYLSGSLPTPVPEGAPEAGYMLVKTLPLQRAFNTPGNWQVGAYQFRPFRADGEIGPLAQLCFSGPATHDGYCVEAKKKGRKDSEGFDSVHELSLVPLFTKGEPGFGVLFIASITEVTTVGHLVSLWTYREKEHRFVNIMPPLSYQTDPFGTFALLSTIRPDMEGLAAAADYIYGEEEVHYEPHRFTISLYRYNDKAGMFKPIGSFATRKKYGEGSMDRILRSEMKGIERLLARRK